MSVEMLMDIHEIKSLGYQFADAANRKDYTTFASLWADDGVWDIGEPISIRFNGLAEIKPGIEKMLSLWDFFCQMPHAPIIHINGNTATSRWTMHEIARRADQKEGNFNLALYEDKLKKIAGKWVYKLRMYESIYVDYSKLPGQAFQLPKTNT
jgi:ketosteroid isomerase-like protein